MIPGDWVNAGVSQEVDIRPCPKSPKHRLSNGSSGRTSAGREIMFLKHLVTDIYHPSFRFSVITFPLTERVLKISQDLIKLLKDFGTPLSNPFPMIIQSGA